MAPIAVKMVLLSQTPRPSRKEPTSPSIRSRQVLPVHEGTGSESVDDPIAIPSLLIPVPPHSCPSQFLSLPNPVYPIDGMPGCGCGSGSRVPKAASLLGILIELDPLVRDCRRFDVATRHGEAAPAPRLLQGERVGASRRGGCSTIMDMASHGPPHLLR